MVLVGTVVVVGQGGGGGGRVREERLLKGINIKETKF